MTVPVPVTTTTTTTTRVEQRTHWVRRGFIWVAAPFVDNWSGLSLNRFLAVYFAVASTHGRFVHDEPLTWVDLGMATLSAGLAWGKDVFLAFLNRKNGGTSETSAR